MAGWLRLFLKTTAKGGTILPCGLAADGYPSGDEAQKAMCCFVYNNILQQWNNKPRSQFSPPQRQSKWAFRVTSTALVSSLFLPSCTLSYSRELWLFREVRGYFSVTKKMDTELSATGVIFTLVRRRRLLRNTGDFCPPNSYGGSTRAQSASCCASLAVSTVLEAIVTHRD